MLPRWGSVILRKLTHRFRGGLGSFAPPALDCRTTVREANPARGPYPGFPILLTLADAFRGRPVPFAAG